MPSLEAKKLNHPAAGQGATADDQQPPSEGGGSSGDQPEEPVGRIAHVEQLRGVVVYGAILVFAAFFAKITYDIWSWSPPPPPMGSTAKKVTEGQPQINAAMLTAAVALAGVLGSAFALVTGVQNKEADVNQHLAKGKKEGKETTLYWKLQRIFSVKPPSKDDVSFPLTFGIWLYVFVASWVALTYFLNVNETPAEVKGIAVAFAGYVVAIMTVAYGVRSRG